MEELLKFNKNGQWQIETLEKGDKLSVVEHNEKTHPSNYIPDDQGDVAISIHHSKHGVVGTGTYNKKDKTFKVGPTSKGSKSGIKQHHLDAAVSGHLK